MKSLKQTLINLSKLVLGLAFLAVFVLNFTTSIQKSQDSNGLTLSPLKSYAMVEDLPVVTINCSSGNYGQCFSLNETMGGFPDYSGTCQCAYTGYTNDSCSFWQEWGCNFIAN